MASGGSYVEPGADAFAFQPLKELESETDITWACEFIELCLTGQHVEVDARKREAIRAALLQLRDTKTPARRDITSFQQYVQDDDVKVGIEPYTLDGEYGAIFDAHDTKLDMSRFIMIEMGILMRLGAACITPALMYLFKFIEMELSIIVQS